MIFPATPLSTGDDGDHGLDGDTNDMNDDGDGDKEEGWSAIKGDTTVTIDGTSVPTTPEADTREQSFLDASQANADDRGQDDADDGEHDASEEAMAATSVYALDGITTNVTGTATEEPLPGINYLPQQSFWWIIQIKIV